MNKERNLQAMENCVCFNLRRASRVVTQYFDAELRRHGVRPTQTPILAALAARSGWGMDELSEWLGMERTTLVRNLRPLQRDGLVETANAGGRKRVSLSIAARGRKRLQRLLPAWREAQNAVVGTLGRRRWSLILAELETAARALAP